MAKVTTEKFIERANLVHGDQYDYSKVKYVNISGKVEIVCKKHGSFFQSHRLHVERKNGCPQCGIEKPKRTSITEDEFFRKAGEVHNKKYDYTDSKYLGPKLPIQIRCQVHGIFTIRSARLHIHNKNGCQKCAVRSTTEEFISKSAKLFGDYYQYHLAQYSTIYTELTIVCPEHGEQRITPVDHYRIGCWFCKRIRCQDIWLDEVGVPNTKINRQVRIQIGEKLFVVDGLIGNTVYLFHGDYWHGNPKLYESTNVNLRNGKTFGELYENTLLYEKSLVEAGYKVESVWEHDWLQSKRA